MDELTIVSPVDMHVHFRQGEMLRRVVPSTAGTWSAAIAMPNTEPPIGTPAGADAYRWEIEDAAAAAGFPDFRAYPTLYFRTDYTRDFLAGAKSHVLAVKFYPRGLTTNSAHGCDPADPAILPVLAAMEELGIPLSVHPEAPGYHEDREHLFTAHARAWARRFPDLTIVLEHLSDRRSVDLLDLPNVYATVTPQHLLLTGDDLMGPPFRTHLYCMPVLKRPEDRAALRDACFRHHPDKIMAGTDSAPHAERRKLECGCAGCFTAPIALQLYAQAFDRDGRLDLLPGFLSGNARRIHGIDPPAKVIRLIREPSVVPERYGDVVPLMAGESLDWSVAS